MNGSQTIAPPDYGQEKVLLNPTNGMLFLVVNTLLILLAIAGFVLALVVS